jgi:hypothetical protein
MVSCRECIYAPLPVFQISPPVFPPDPHAILSGYKKLQERLIELDVHAHAVAARTLQEYYEIDSLECNADGTIRVSKCPDTLKEVAHMEP